jgi:sialate O-acetylesterase
MSMRNKQCGLLVIIVSFLSIPLFANIRLPKLISDGMVLQRETNVRIWGYAAARGSISMVFCDSVYKTAANDAGTWEVKLASLKAGGPFTMTFTGNNSIVIKNILIGDVWLCSGQSNMELPM